MKSKELIRLLQEADPTGEVEVGIGNHDIYCVEPMPAYYDGRFQKLIRDETKAGYNVAGAKYCSHGEKIKIHSMGVTDVLWHNPDAPVDYSELGNYSYVEDMKKTDDATRQASRDVELRVEMGAFYDWVKKKAEKIRPYEDCREESDHFYKKNLSPKDPVKDLPPKIKKEGGFLGIGGTTYQEWPSWAERREAMWDDTIEVSWDGGWSIERKDSDASTD